MLTDLRQNISAISTDLGLSVPLFILQTLKFTNLLDVVAEWRSEQAYI